MLQGLECCLIVIAKTGERTRVSRRSIGWRDGGQRPLFCTYQALLCDLCQQFILCIVNDGVREAAAWCVVCPQSSLSPSASVSFFPSHPSLLLPRSLVRSLLTSTESLLMRFYIKWTLFLFITPSACLSVCVCLCVCVCVCVCLSSHLADTLLLDAIHDPRVNSSSILFSSLFLSISKSLSLPKFEFEPSRKPMVNRFNEMKREGAE